MLSFIIYLNIVFFCCSILALMKSNIVAIPPLLTFSSVYQRLNICLFGVSSLWYSFSFACNKVNLSLKNTAMLIINFLFWLFSKCYDVDQDRVPKELTAALVHLRYFFMEHMCFIENKKIHLLLFVIRNSPNLENLTLEVNKHK